jgi:DNA-binding CsgD family transcriptional regulator
MTIRLSSADIARLHSAQTTLVSALGFESVEAWAGQAMAETIAVLGADKAYFALPTASGMFTAAAGDRTEDGLTAYLAYYWQTDLVLRQRRVELGLEVYHRDMLYHPGEMARDELHNDWCVPHALYDTLGMGFDVDSNAALPALLHVYHHRNVTTFGKRGVALMQLLLPAFKAGVAAWRELYERRRTLAASLDTLGVALMMLDSDGVALHRTPALTSLVSADEDRALIDQAAARVARNLTASHSPTRRKTGPSAPAPVTHGVVTRAARYTVRACTAPSGLTGKPTVLVTVERSSRPPIDVDDAARRHGLTARQKDVAVRLVRGDSISAIAQILGMSRHTARHHVEHIIARLGAHSRAEAVAMLMNESIPPCPEQPR